MLRLAQPLIDQIGGLTLRPNAVFAWHWDRWPLTIVQDLISKIFVFCTNKCNFNNLKWNCVVFVLYETVLYVFWRALIMCEGCLFKDQQGRTIIWYKGFKRPWVFLMFLIKQQGVTSISMSEKALIWFLALVGLLRLWATTWSTHLTANLQWESCQSSRRSKTNTPILTPNSEGLI